MGDLRTELIRLFECSEAPVIQGDTVKLTTRLEPEQVAAALDQLSVKHGGASFSGGGIIP
jgi:hypothetical protein